MNDDYVYQSKIYEPAAPWSGRDGWSGWNDISFEDYEAHLKWPDADVQVRRLKVDMLNGKPV